MSLTDYSTNQANNGVVAGQSYWPEGMPPSLVNEAGRLMMADLATWLRGAGGLTAVRGATTYTVYDSGNFNVTTALGYTPVQQGTGIGQLANVVKIGWDGSALRAQVDLTDLGRFVTETRLAGALVPVNGTAMRRNGVDLYGPDNLNLASKQDALGYTPVQQNGGTGQLTNKLYLGWDGISLRMQVDASDIGRLVTETRLAGGALSMNGAVMRRNGADLYGTDNFNPATKQDALGFVPVQQNGGSGMLTNKLYLGWDGDKIRAQIDASYQGGLAIDGSGRTRCVITDGTAAPSGGLDGDIYFQYA